MDLIKIIEQDIIKLTTQSDSDNRGLSDRMLFYLNAYTASQGIVNQHIRNKILISANNTVIEYNSYKSHDAFSILFFEIYYALLIGVFKENIHYECLL